MGYKDPEKQRRAQRAHYLRNRQARIDRSAMEKKERTKVLTGISRVIRAFTPCADCDQHFPPECMDFDHVRGVKDRAVAELATRGVSVRRFIAEIQKCEVVCSNCHRLRTARRRIQI